MSYIYLIRHGQTSWNLEERFQGTTNTELTEVGINQGKLLAKSLSKTKFENIYSSPLKRAKITADFIGSEVNCEVIEDLDFKEISFGDWEGLSTKEIREKYPWMDKWFDDTGLFQIPNGDVFEDEKNRLKERLIKIAKESNGQNTAIVSHAGIIRLSLLAALDLPLSYYWRFVLGNTSINILEYHNGMFFLKSLNDTSHLLSK
ncbi:MAG: putative phosphoglycerate mutase [Fusobacteria bacterium]|nr:MAG: putative phosphoglycerate mutase [Fusobacteriota bacterium]KAF0229900.1 MAG: putative phosphoglycerate [Fusobacteriota bacterium]